MPHVRLYGSVKKLINKCIYNKYRKGERTQLSHALLNFLGFRLQAFPHHRTRWVLVYTNYSLHARVSPHSCAASPLAPHATQYQMFHAHPIVPHNPYTHLLKTTAMHSIWLGVAPHISCDIFTVCCLSHNIHAITISWQIFHSATAKSWIIIIQPPLSECFKSIIIVVVVA